MRLQVLQNDIGHLAITIDLAFECIIALVDISPGGARVHQHDAQLPFRSQRLVHLPDADEEIERGLIRPSQPESCLASS